jgi:hypothetical protein
MATAYAADRRGQTLRLDGVFYNGYDRTQLRPVHDTWPA